MNLETWADGAWADGSWVPESWGIGLAEAAGIGIAVRNPIDFVLTGTRLANYFQPYRRTFRLDTAPKAKGEGGELQEMLELYSRWRKAA